MHNKVCELAVEREATCYSTSQDPAVPKIFFSDAVKRWNSLPADSTSCTSLHIIMFKKSFCGHDYLFLSSSPPFLLLLMATYLYIHVCHCICHAEIVIDKKNNNNNKKKQHTQATAPSVIRYTHYLIIICI